MPVLLLLWQPRWPKGESVSGGLFVRKVGTLGDKGCVLMDPLGTGD